MSIQLKVSAQSSREQFSNVFHLIELNIDFYKNRQSGTGTDREKWRSESSKMMWMVRNFQ